MKTATVHDLRTRFSMLEGWLREGHSVSITRRGVFIASLVPAQTGNHVGKKVDFAAQLKRIWGDKQFTHEESQRMFRSYREGEEG